MRNVGGRYSAGETTAEPKLECPALLTRRRTVNVIIVKEVLPLVSSQVLRNCLDAHAASSAHGNLHVRVLVSSRCEIISYRFNIPNVNSAIPRIRCGSI